MNKQLLTDKLSLFDLKPADLKAIDEILETDDIIEQISNSGLLYRRSIRQIILRRIRDFVEDYSLKPHDQLEMYFPRNERKQLWSRFRGELQMQAPGLRLTRFAQLLSFLTVVGSIYLIWNLLSGGIEFLLAWKLAGLSFLPIVGLLLFIPLGIIFNNGTNRLPAKTVDDLIDQIVIMNNIDLLASDKKLLKQFLKDEMGRNSQLT